MVVSDLDGTMVGDDAKTAAFSEVWHDRTSFPPGSVLVYSTGRSLQSFTELITEKKDVMAIPDALICAVGTKIYKRLDTTTEKRNLIESTLGGLIKRDAPNNNNNSELGNWVEDYDWTESLDKGWNFQNVFDAALVAVDLVGGDNAHLRPPDEFTEHKITLGVRDEFVDDVLEYMTTACAMHDLNPKLITSGTGGWQYLDVVSNQGGKLESLEYVRTAFGVEVNRCVACGDSGNDVLMLAGKNKAIVVGNAQPALMQWAVSQRIVDDESVSQDVDDSSSERLFIASEPEALGILQGLRRFGLLAADEV